IDARGEIIEPGKKDDEATRVDAAIENRYASATSGCGQNVPFYRVHSIGYDCDYTLSMPFCLPACIAPAYEP
ncbi:MAG: hypothetical protein V3R80_03940, partial [Candidatus Tectomicrobia bacterium]